MKIADLLLLVGLAIGIIAGVLLAYDALHAPGAPEFGHFLSA